MLLNKERLKAFLEKAKKVSDQAELYLISKQQLKIDVINQKIESIDELEEAGLSVRLITKSRPGFAYTADLDDAAIDDSIEQAARNAAAGSADEWMDLPGAEEQKAKMELVDPDLASVSLIDKKALALDVERFAMTYDKRIKRAEKTSYQEDLLTTVLINSKGVDVEYKKAICGAFTEVIAEENGLMETGSWLTYSTRYNQLDAASIGGEAGARAVAMLGASQEVSGRAPVVLEPYVGSMILSMMSPALSAEYAQKGKSLFISARGKSVASKKVTLVDSGVLQDGLATIPYDDEGVPTMETIIIKDGTFTDFLFNRRSANKAKRGSTGNAIRSSFKVQPEILPTNLFIKPGHRTRDDLIGGISKGFLVTTIMGAHTINPISGDFSIGFSGHYIENGKIARPVRGMTIAGNLVDLLSRIEDVGSDLMFFPLAGNIGTPSLLISGLSVSGL